MGVRRCSKRHVNIGSGHWRLLCFISMIERLVELPWESGDELLRRRQFTISADVCSYIIIYGDAAGSRVLYCLSVGISCETDRPDCMIQAWSSGSRRLFKTKEVRGVTATQI